MSAGARRMWAAAAVLAAAPVSAQDDQQPAQQQQPTFVLERAGRVANSAVGEAGQRLTRDTAPAAIRPAGRIGGRVQNRVQNRIRNRIDRNYDPQANAAEPFAVADQAVTGSR